ncbi:MAG: hypothetical protein AAFV29_04345, partial [Myxococcota bacterium]
TTLRVADTGDIRLDTIVEASVYGRLLRDAEWVRQVKDRVYAVEAPTRVARDVYVHPPSALPPV